MRIHEVKHGSPEWWTLRAGIPTASCFKNILTAVGKRCVLAHGHTGPHAIDGKPSKLKAGFRCQVNVPQPSAGMYTYIDELIGQVVSPQAKYLSDTGTRSMDTGREREPQARRWYEREFDCNLTINRFLMTDDGRFGSSPDACLFEGPILLKGLEIKCPDPDTHARYLREGGLPNEYKQQVHGSMALWGVPWDFVSYHPDFVDKQLHIEVLPDDYTDSLKAALEPFWEKYNEASLKVLGKPAPGCRPEAFRASLAVFDAWLAKLKLPESVEQMNAGIETLAELKLVEPVKWAAWEKICKLAKGQGWAYDQAKKRFYKPAPTAEPAF